MLTSNCGTIDSMERIEFSPSQIDQILNLRRSNISIFKIAKKYGTSYCTIYRLLKKYGVKQDSRKDRLHLNSKIKSIIDDYSSGMSMEEVGKRHKCSSGTIRKKLIEHGVTPREVGPIPDPDRPRNRGGYVGVGLPEADPMRSMLRIDGVVLEHRLKMARHLGRMLHPWETVHHKDRDPQNNDISNLQLRVGQHGPGAVYRCSDCGSFKIHPEEI